MRLEVQVSVRVRTLPEHRGRQGSISVMSNPCVQERQCAFRLHFGCELNSRFNGVQVFVEALDLVVG